MNFDLHWYGLSRDLLVSFLLLLAGKLWAITSSYILTHYIIDGVIRRASGWLKRHPLEHAIVHHYTDKHKKNNPADTTPQVCEQGYCVIVPVK